LNETITEYTEQAAAIERAEFVQTDLSVDATASETSFVNPLKIWGRLTSNGTAVTQQRIRITVGNRRFRTATDASRNFTLQYRPVEMPRGRQTLQVEYIPATDSDHRRATATVTVDVKPTRANVSIDASPTAVKFNQTISITGRVVADGRPVP